MAKSGTHFHFKHFSVRHDRCSMKVGTDGVLLGAWAQVEGAQHVLDIGTGTGVIALMVAQRTTPATQIEGIELDTDAAAQAKENVLASPWASQLTIYATSLQRFQTDKKYDLVLSNPPYFLNSQEPPDEKRLQTRHAVTLTFTELLSHVSMLLTDEGTFNVILPNTEGLHFMHLAAIHGLHLKRQWSFRTRVTKPIERWLMAFSKQFTATPEKGEILLYDQGTQWSETYRQLTRDFYLRA